MKAAQIKKILLITLSNIGDAVLTTPVLDILKRNFGTAVLHLMVSENAAGVFSKDKRADKIIIYDKHKKFKEKIALLSSLKKMRYDLVVDLRNTVLPVFLNPKFSTTFFKNAPKNILFMKERHLWKIKALGLDTEGATLSIGYDEADETRIKNLLKNSGIKDKDRFICVSPGAKSHIKRWPKEKFLKLSQRLIDELGFNVILIGSGGDIDITKYISSSIKEKIFDFTGLTTVPELSVLFKSASALITNDSAPMHIAASCDTPVIAIFGPTDTRKYGPQSKKSAVIRKPLLCSPCEVALCRLNHECMNLIEVDEVFSKAKAILESV
jgi:lipopolysaccharide heptosyltransferase II